MASQRVDFTRYKRMLMARELDGGHLGIPHAGSNHRPLVDVDSESGRKGVEAEPPNGNLKTAGSSTQHQKEASST
jgi:hypothetical protein